MMFFRPNLSRMLLNLGRLKCISPTHIRITRLRILMHFDFNRCFSDRYGKEEPPQEPLSSSEETSVDGNDIEVFDVEKEKKKWREPAQLPKYKIFKDEESPVILDVEEERLVSKLKEASTQLQRDEFHGMSLERGERGVFTPVELVSVLKSLNAANIVVIKLPENLSYADHMIIVSGKSARHQLSVAEYIRRLFKKKRSESDRIPIIEGKRTKNNDWLALDLGNIILHIFSMSTREEYDLESLWALGPEYDPHLNQKEESLDSIVQKHLNAFPPLQSS